MIQNSKKEFVILMAMLMALSALSTSTVLPAFDLIKRSLQVESNHQMQFIISVFMIGMVMGQLTFGSIADLYGRKQSVIIGLILFTLGSLMSMFANTFFIMLCGRFIQGFGVSSPRIICISIIRDRYSGKQMAEVLSFIMSVFILIPMIAPVIGDMIISFSTWKTIFVFFVLFAIFLSTWFYIRINDNPIKNKSDIFFIQIIVSNFSIVIKTKNTVFYTVALGLVYSIFISYLNSAWQIFNSIFNAGTNFTMYFAILASSISISSFVNGLLVKHFGINNLCTIALTIIILLSLLFFIIFDLNQSNKLLIPYMIYMFTTFFCYGLLFSNINTLAMEPMGDQAGTAAGVVGSISTTMSIIIGGVIGQCFDYTLKPLVIGFFLMSLCALALHYKANLSQKHSISPEDNVIETLEAK